MAVLPHTSQGRGQQDLVFSIAPLDTSHNGMTLGSNLGLDAVTG